MKTTIEFLDAVMKKNGITSDNQLANFLGCTRSTISGYRHKKTYFDDSIAMKVADSLDIDPVHVFACAHAERERDSKIKKVWERFATLTAGLAVLVILSVTVPTAGHESALFAAFTASHPVYYVKSIFEYWPLFMALFIIVFLARPCNIASKK